MGQAALKDCPICHKPSAERFRPFCSARCADVDLGRWLTETYRAPTEERVNQTPSSTDESDD
jgi:endogenous inhibitor of DNA gyrase (YacG/DUF329 family)